MFYYFVSNLLYISDKAPTFVLCSASCPVWICEDAINPSHPCKFLYCNDCRSQEMSGSNDGIRQTRHQSCAHKPKRVKTNPVSYYDDIANYNDANMECNHKMESLKKLEDGKYFTEEYVRDKTETPNCYYASVCVKCSAHVRDRVPA